MTTSVSVDTRLKSKIESMTEYNNGVYSINFKDIEDTFWFDSYEYMQNFLREQDSERFYDKELRKGYFDYINENNDTIRYYVEVNRGKVLSYKEKIIN